MSQRMILKKLNEVVPGDFNKGDNEFRLSSKQLLELYKDSLMTCNDIIAVLPFLSDGTKEQVKEEIYKRQWEFWNAPRQVRYYAEIHPQLPPVPGHFEYLVEQISPQDRETVVDLGCGCGALIKALIEASGEVKIIGIDYAPNALDMVSELTPHLGNGRVKLINHDLRKGIPLSDESQTKMVSNWGIAYMLPDDLQANLHETHRVLEPEGKFICSAMVAGQKLDLLGFLKSAPKKLHFLWEVIRKPRVIQTAQRFGADLRRLFPVYSPEELVEMIEKAGLRVGQQELTLMGKSTTIVAQKPERES